MFDDSRSRLDLEAGAGLVLDRDPILRRFPESSIR